MAWSDREGVQQADWGPLGLPEAPSHEPKTVLTKSMSLVPSQPVGHQRLRGNQHGISGPQVVGGRGFGPGGTGGEEGGLRASAFSAG